MKLLEAILGVPVLIICLIILFSGSSKKQEKRSKSSSVYENPDVQRVLKHLIRELFR